MCKTLIAAGWLLAMAGTALAQQTQGQGQGPGTAPGPKPGKQQNTGLFPPHEPAPMFSTSNNNGTASLQAPNSASPNAGNTGPSGSAGQSHGWTPPAYQSPSGQR